MNGVIVFIGVVIGGVIIGFIGYFVLGVAAMWIDAICKIFKKKK